LQLVVAGQENYVGPEEPFDELIQIGMWQLNMGKEAGPAMEVEEFKW